MKKKEADPFEGRNRVVRAVHWLPATQGGNPMAARTADYGDRMIVVEVRFFANKLAKDGKIRPKHAWTGGMAGIPANKAHGIKTHTTTSLLNRFGARELGHSRDCHFC